MNQNKIEIRNLSKSFGDNVILEDINLDIKNGESFVIIGGSGSGKSVILKNILGLMEPDRGSIKIDGQETTNLSFGERNKFMKKIGMLFQGGALFDSLPVWQNVGFSLTESGKYSDKQIKDVVKMMLNSVSLEPEIMDLYPAELSGGMGKRVSLARTLMGNSEIEKSETGQLEVKGPEIIFFDEPTTGLDPISANVINDLIKNNKKNSVTTVTITHDMNSLMHIATQVAMLYKGKIIWQGDIEELKNTDNKYVKQFINGEIKGPIEVNY